MVELWRYLITIILLLGLTAIFGFCNLPPRPEQTQGNRYEEALH